jgi:hypothetical protein
MKSTNVEEKKMFLLVAKTHLSNSGESWSCVKEFASDEDAIEFILNSIVFEVAGDGDGTTFGAIKEGDYIAIEGRFFVCPASLQDNMDVPSEVMKKFFPY